MPRFSPTARRFAGVLAVIVILLVVVPRQSSAQTAASLTLGPIAHRADGTLLATLSATPEELASLEVSINGALVPFEVSESVAGTPARVVFAIENSVSMTAFQLAEVQSGARSLVDSLSATDEVGIVLFGGGASTVLPLTTDRAAFENALNSITLDGGSALYSGVAMAGEALRLGNGPALIALVSYGWDWGGVSTHTREASFASVSDAGAAVYVQAMVFDGSVDVGYLAPLATDGLIRDATQVGFLANATSLLGTAAPTRTLTASGPALALGTHEFRITSDSGAEQAVTFEVVNDGLLSVSVTSGDEPAAPLIAQITSALALSAFEVTASLAGTPLDVAPGGSIAIDPWTFDAGVADIEVQLTVAGALAAATTNSVTIPPLAPQLAVDQSGEETVTASVLAQPGSALTLVALIDGAVVAENADGTLTVDRPSTGSLSFEVRSADGVAVLSEAVAKAAVIEPGATDAVVSTDAGDSSILNSPTMLALPLALIAVLLLLGRRRASRGPRGSVLATAQVGSDTNATSPPPMAQIPEPPLNVVSEPEPEPEPEPTPIPLPAPPATVGRSRFRMFDRHRGDTPIPIQAADWSVVVRTPDGALQRIEVGFEPVSLGASKLCTVTLDGEAVRFVHLVIAREGRDVKAHQFGPVSVNGQNRDVEDGSVLTETVMEIGNVAIWLERTVADSAAVDAA